MIKLAAAFPADPRPLLRVLPGLLAQRLNREINKILQTPEMEKRMEGMNLEPPPNKSAEDFRKVIAKDTATWKSIASDLNLKIANAKGVGGGTDEPNDLLDQRDQLMQQLSGFTNISSTIGVDQTVEVRIGGAPAWADRWAAAG